MSFPHTHRLINLTHLEVIRKQAKITDVNILAYSPKTRQEVDSCLCGMLTSDYGLLALVGISTEE